MAMAFGSTRGLLTEVFPTVVLALVTLISWVRADICQGPVCYYQLHARFFQSMSYQDPVTFNLNKVTLNGSTYLDALSGAPLPQSIADSIIPTDGFARTIVTINGQFQGPTIEVMEGVQVVVNVTNGLTQREITMHWHGMVLLNNYLMDGVPGVTQCGIRPGETWTYRFNATPAGTHFYHSHVASLRVDGFQGILIVHKTLPTIPYYAAFIQDWSHITSEQYEISSDVSGLLCENGAKTPPYEPPGGFPAAIECTPDGAELPTVAWVSALFGGRGRFQGATVPLAEYVVKPGQRLRFRLVHGGLIYPLRISVDSHKLSIVASDGHEIQPVVADAVWIHVVETMDFEIIADQTPSRYWIRAESPCRGSGTAAILAYSAFQNTGADPTSSPATCSPTSPCTVFNCPFKQYPPGSGWSCILLSNAQSTLSAQELKTKYGIGDDPATIKTYFVNFAMVAGASVNGRRFAMPKVPLFQTLKDSDCVGEPCGEDGCKCRCTQMLKLPFNTTVRLVISNKTPNPNIQQHGYHTIHLHGHNFAVMNDGYPDYDNVTGHWVRANANVSCDSDMCAHPTWATTPPDLSGVVQPPIKDSFVVPIQGYRVIQFRTNNPGYFMLHCHIELHMTAGMTIILQVEPKRVSIPKGYPTCGDYFGSASTSLIALHTLLVALAVSFLWQLSFHRTPHFSR